MALLVTFHGEYARGRTLSEKALLFFQNAGNERTISFALVNSALCLCWADSRDAEIIQQGHALAALEPVTMPTQAPAEPSSVSHTPNASTSPNRLTRREAEVLHLVAQGLTDAQVAEQLVISRRTVNFHLTSVYSKISVSSRAAASRYTIEHHLV